jgi:VCBS repeat-containing protein/parallel beta-helix repeat protein
MGALGNRLNGIWIAQGASNNLIGGTLSGAGNVVSGNLDTGIEIQDSSSTGNVIAGNIVGLDAAGATALGNLDGIIIENAPGNTIGGAAAARNIVSGNTGGNQGDGIVIFGSNATGNLVQNNFIGTDLSGNLDRGNSGNGILISDRGDGGGVKGAVNGNVIRDNIISGNDQTGVAITGGSSRNVIQGNSIGMQASGAGSLGNLLSAVYIKGSNNLIGGTAAGAGNVLAFSAMSNGVHVHSGNGNAILGNSIFSNALIGIALGGLGSSVSPNDLLDTDGGANRQQNFPALTSSQTTGATITVTGTLSSTPNKNYRIEFFASATTDTTGHGEGQRYLGFTTVTTNVLGSANINVTLPVSVAAGEFISATATDLATYDTSEFAQSIVASAANTAPTITSNGGGGTATVTVSESTVTVTTVTATDLQAPPQTLTYSIIGGADSAQFTINSSTGVLTFVTAPNFESPTDFNTDNVYSVTIQVSDGNGGTDSQAMNISVVDVNDAPKAPNDLYSLSEDSILSVAQSGVLGNDSDEDSGATALTAILVSPTSNGTLSLAADGSFIYSPNNNFSGTDSFSYRVSDGSSNSNIATVTITVNPVNDAPVAADDGYSTSMDVPLLILAPGVLANDSDAEGNPIFATLVSGPPNGLISLNPNGSFLYTPNSLFVGLDSFTYQATDLLGNSNIAAVTINVTSLNSPPNAVSDSYSVAEDMTLVVATAGVLANDTDANSDPLTVALVGTTSNGTLTLNADGSFTYSPNPNFNGTDSFTYRINDGSANSNLAAVTITVYPLNDAPVANNDGFNASEDSALTVPAAGVRENDTDLDGDSISVILVSGPNNGTLTLNPDGSFSYMPNVNFNGADTFSYRADDGTTTSNVASVTITVNPVNDAPLANSDNYSVNEDGVLTASGPGVLGNDTDPDGNALSAVLVSRPGNGFLVFDADGSFTYTPFVNFSGSDSFSYLANDAQANSAAVRVNLLVSPQNDLPIARDDAFTIESSETFVLVADGVLSNDRDPDGDALAAVLVSGPAHGALKWNSDGSFVYSPGARFRGIDSFTYRASDGPGASNLAKVTIDVRQSAPPPGENGQPKSTVPHEPAPIESTKPPTPTEAANQPVPTQPVVGNNSASNDLAHRPRAAPLGQHSTTSGDTRTTYSRTQLFAGNHSHDALLSDRTRRNDSRVVPAGGTTLPASYYMLDPGLIASGDALWRELDTLKIAMALSSDLPGVVVGSIVTSSLGMSLGYVLWVLRSGYLLSSLLASMPAWQFIDPLPVLEYPEDDPDEREQDDESLDSLIEKNTEALSETNRTDIPNEQCNI